MARAVELEWKGRVYVVPEERAFALGEVVEDIVTLPEIAAMQNKPRFRKIARAYGAMLRFAGAQCTDDDVYSSLMADLKAGRVQPDAAWGAALRQLVALMMDGAPDEPAGHDEGNGEAPQEESAPSS